MEQRFGEGNHLTGGPLWRLLQPPPSAGSTEYMRGYNDGVQRGIVLIGAFLAAFWFCAVAAFPRLHLPLRRAAGGLLGQRVREGELQVVWFQQVRHPLLDVLHNALALMCGVEFYITVLPFLFWIGEPVLARSMCVFTAGMTYIGNALKDAFCSPRPRSPPVRRTSRHAQGDTGLSATEEYGAAWAGAGLEPGAGFPSTHSINAVCFAGYLIHFFNKQGHFTTGGWWSPEWWPRAWLPPSVLSALVLWCGNICYGRIYLGMHTPVDILGGVLLGWMILGFWIAVEDFVDAWITSGFWFLPIYQLLYSLVILWSYPVPERPNPSFSYSLYLTAASNGVVIGVWRTFPRIHSLAWGGAVRAARGPLLSLAGLQFVALRFCVGIPIVLVAREIGKQLGLLILPPISRLLKLNAKFEDKKGGAASVPSNTINLSNGYRFIAYTFVGWATTDWCFIAFGALGI